jgi:uncharacterized protein with GYD domain
VTKALMLIKSSYGGALLITQEAKKVSGVEEVYLVFGRYDVAAFIDVADFQRVKETAVKVGQLEGVRSTETLPEGD